METSGLQYLLNISHKNKLFKSEISHNIISMCLSIRPSMVLVSNDQQENNEKLDIKIW